MKSMQISTWWEFPTDFSSLDFSHCLILNYCKPPNYKHVFFYVYINSKYVVSSETWSETVAFFFHIYLKSIGANDAPEGEHVPKATVYYLNIWQHNSGSFDKTDW